MSLPFPRYSLMPAVRAVICIGVLAGLSGMQEASGALPDLAQLKAAAERGEAKAQYEYGLKIGSSNAPESFAMLLRSAQQGYGLAEGAVGMRYLRDANFKPKERSTLERSGVRYVSRAAFKGFADAQAELSRCYDRGVAVPKDAGLAYGWLAIALKTSGGPKALVALVYKTNLDQLIARVSSAEIARGEKFAAEFRLGMRNFVEVDVLVSQLKLTAFYVINGKKFAVVNQTKISEGETKRVMVDGEMIELTCVRIVGRAADFKSGIYEFRLSAP